MFVTERELGEADTLLWILHAPSPGVWSLFRINSYPNPHNAWANQCQLRAWLASKPDLRSDEPLFPASGRVPGSKERKTHKMMQRDPGGLNFPESFGLRSYENGRDMPTDVGPWFLIDRAIAYPWSYVNNKRYRDGADYHVRSLVDVVSRGGIFLLSLTPKGDGSIPPEEQEIMRNIGRWLTINGEAIYAARPWKTYAGGPTVCRGTKRNAKGEEKEQWDWRQDFTAQDIRFTTKGDTIYAIALAWPENGRLTVRSLAKGTSPNIGSVSLLGHTGPLTWSQSANGLEVTLPAKQPCDYTFSLRITPK